MRSVVVCASKRYKDEVAKFCDQLEKLGVAVFRPNFKKVVPEDSHFHSEYITGMVFKGFTLEHFDWVRKADVCYIFNKNGYVGASTTLEMGYATALGKPLYALEADTGDPCRDCLIDKVVSTPKALAKLL